MSAPGRPAIAGPPTGSLGLAVAAIDRAVYHLADAALEAAGTPGHEAAKALARQLRDAANRVCELGSGL